MNLALPTVITERSLHPHNISVLALAEHGSGNRNNNQHLVGSGGYGWYNIVATFYAYLSGGSIQFINSGIIEMISLSALGRDTVSAVEFLRRG